MSICSSTPQHGGYTNSSFLEGDAKVRKMSCPAILNNLYEPKMDVILTIRFKITAVVLQHEKFLQFDWLRAVVFQLNLKYLHVKITNLL